MIAPQLLAAVAVRVLITCMCGEEGGGGEGTEWSHVTFTNPGSQAFTAQR